MKPVVCGMKPSPTATVLFRVKGDWGGHFDNVVTLKWEMINDIDAILGMWSLATNMKIMRGQNIILGGGVGDNQTRFLTRKIQYLYRK